MPINRGAGKKALDAGNQHAGKADFVLSVQRSDISKIFLRNGEKSGAALAAPPIPYDYTVTLICSTRDFILTKL